MKTRFLVFGGAVLLAACAGGSWWLAHRDQAESAAEADQAPLPVPPIPPRIAEGRDYDRCLGMLAADPAGAASFADAWEATGGGEGAAHCRALAEIAAGNAESGAGMLEALAANSQAPDVARASVYGQASQAWLIAGDAGHAFGDSTMALALSPDDPDLLVDRSVAAATLERYQDTIEDLDRALEIDPQRPDALVFRAAAWRELGHLNLAQDDIDRALTLDPDSPDALLERGILRQRRGDPAGARADWERASALAPDTATADLARQNLALLEVGPERR